MNEEPLPALHIGSANNQGFTDGTLQLYDDNNGPNAQLHSVSMTTSGLNTVGSFSFDLTPVDNKKYCLVMTGNIDPNDNGKAVTLDVHAVPLPAAVWLFGSAILGLVGFRRKTGNTESLAAA